MVQAKPLTRSATLVAAAGLAAAGLSVIAAPAQAAPGGCEQFTFAGFTTLRANQGPGVDLNFNSNDPTVNAPLTSPQQPGVTANIQGGIDANGHVELNLTPMGGEAENVQRFTGDVAPDNKIHGQFITGNGAIPAETLGALKCAKETPKEGPTVEYSPILGGLNVHVTDRSGTTSQCTYDSDGFTRTFRLDANGATDLKIVPAIPKFSNWNVKITCDNGAVTETTQFF